MEENKYCTIYLVRHGETENNIKKIIQGHVDSPLTALGNEQAVQLAKDLENVHFDAVFSSDLMRAKRTAEVVAINRKLAVNTTILLRERNFGSYEGRSEDDYRSENKAMFEKLNYLNEQERRTFKPYLDYETNEEIVGRMITFLREVSVTYAGKNVLAITHGSIIIAFLRHLDFEKYFEVSVDNTGYIKLLSDGVDFFVSGLKRIVAYPNFD